MNASIEILARRVAELDNENGVAWRRALNCASGRASHEMLSHFIFTLSAYTNTVMLEALGSTAVIDPNEADQLVGESLLVKLLGQYIPSIVEGPLATKSQDWISTGRHDVTGPSQLHFTKPERGAIYDNKPFGLGMFTSSVISGCSMWQMLLDRSGPDPVLYPAPWRTWRLELATDVRVMEIKTARQWTEFVANNAQYADGYVRVDWSKVARRWDGVHITLPAIVAAQGFQFEAEHGLVAPVFWDIESTLWVKWVCTKAKLCREIFDPSPKYTD